MGLAGGARIGTYEIVEPLGAGGMGEVYRARDTRLDRSVAVKVLKAETVANPASVRRFEQEARAASALNHPGIVTIHDTGQSDGQFYIVMELVEGVTLRHLLRRGAPALKRALNLAAQLASALATARVTGPPTVTAIALTVLSALPMSGLLRPPGPSSCASCARRCSTCSARITSARPGRRGSANGRSSFAMCS